jgi:hypothetical protein
VKTFTSLFPKNPIYPLDVSKSLISDTTVRPDVYERIMARFEDQKSPGYPVAYSCPNNARVRERKTFFRVALSERLIRMTEAFDALWLKYGYNIPDKPDPLLARSLVESGVCDPIRIFGKREPTPKRKETRCIFSPSIIDQQAELFLTADMSENEVRRWEDHGFANSGNPFLDEQGVPSTIGIGLLCDDENKRFYERMLKMHKTTPLVCTDVRNWDWSYQGYWFFMGMLSMSYSLVGSFDPTNLTCKLLYVRMLCLMNQVIMRSDGKLLARTRFGWPSGSRWTSLVNSRVRAWLPWWFWKSPQQSLAQGDDCVETDHSDLVEVYLRNGLEVSDVKYPAAEKPLFHFCSHVFGSLLAVPESCEKSIAKFLAGNKTQEQLQQLDLVYRNYPGWDNERSKLLKYMP